VITFLIFDAASIGFFSGWKLAPKKTILNFPKFLNCLPGTLKETHQRFLPVRGKWSEHDEGKPNLTRLWNIESGSGYGSLILKRTSELLSMPIDGNLQTDWRDGQNRNLDLMAIRYLSIRLEKDDSGLSSADNRWRPIRQFGKSMIIENRRAMPRAWLVSEVMQAQRKEVREAIFKSILPNEMKFNPLEIALVEEDFSFKDKEDPHAKVRIKKIEKTNMEIDVGTSHPAFLVVSDTYYPGWTVKVNNTDMHLYRTNYLFRGVPVPSGSSRVRMEFRPSSFRLGLAITTASFLLLASMTLWSMIRKTASKTSN
jgi:hypothetical protein